MRVSLVHCIDDLSRGGAQFVVRMLVQYADRTRFAPIVYAFKDGPIGDEIRANSIPVYVLGRHLPMLDPALVWRVRQRLARDQASLIHAHLLGSRLHCSLASYLGLKLPCIATVHSSVDPYRWRQRIAERRILRHMSRLVAVSELVRASVGRLDRKLEARTCVIYNGVNSSQSYESRKRDELRRKLGIGLSHHVLLAVGRLHPIKGYDVLLHAMVKVVKSHPRTMLLVAGKGELYGELTNLRARLELDEHVRFLGERPDVPDLLAAADIFVMSSLSEGLPVALLEAMAAGLPCVATAVGGIPEVISHGNNGLLASPRDTEALAECLRSLLEDAQTRLRLAEAARKTTLQRFDARQMVRTYENLYNEVLAETRRSKHYLIGTHD